MAGLSAFGGAYLVKRVFDLRAGIGLGLLALMAWRRGAPASWVGYAEFLLLTIPAKKRLDWPRRRALMNATHRRR